MLAGPHEVRPLRFGERSREARGVANGRRPPRASEGQEADHEKPQATLEESFVLQPYLHIFHSPEHS